MRLGIISDSHGQVQRVRGALALLDRAGVDAIIHCGDVGGIEVLEELAGWRCWFVWGNTDWPRPQWQAEVEELGLPWPTGPLHLVLAGRRVAVYHGCEPGFRRAIETGQHDYLLHGHSHRREDYRVGRTRVINPGALYRASVHTMALLDVAADEVQFLAADGDILG